MREVDLMLRILRLAGWDAGAPFRLRKIAMRYPLAGRAIRGECDFSKCNRPSMK
jgi:hypothetical protein